MDIITNKRNLPTHCRIKPNIRVYTYSKSKFIASFLTSAKFFVDQVRVYYILLHVFVHSKYSAIRFGSTGRVKFDSIFPPLVINNTDYRLIENVFKKYVVINNYLSINLSKHIYSAKIIYEVSFHSYISFISVSSSKSSAKSYIKLLRKGKNIFAHFFIFFHEFR